MAKRDMEVDVEGFLIQPSFEMSEYVENVVIFEFTQIAEQ